MNLFESVKRKIPPKQDGDFGKTMPLTQDDISFYSRYERLLKTALTSGTQSVELPKNPIADALEIKKAEFFKDR